jgi:hypothetical protein
LYGCDHNGTAERTVPRTLPKTHNPTTLTPMSPWLSAFFLSLVCSSPYLCIFIAMPPYGDFL